MSFQTSPRRARRDDEDEFSFTEQGSPPVGEGGRGRIFLERWRSRASSRRAKLARELLGSPLNLQRTQNLNMWLRNLESRRSWLQARLEHIVGLESIIRAAIERKPNSA